MASLSPESAGAIYSLQQEAVELEEDVMEDIDVMFQAATSNMQRKLLKDFEVMSKVAKPDNYVLPLTNRSNVSFDLVFLFTSSGTEFRIPQALGPTNKFHDYGISE